MSEVIISITKVFPAFKCLQQILQSYENSKLIIELSYISCINVLSSFSSLPSLSCDLAVKFFIKRGSLFSVHTNSCEC